MLLGSHVAHKLPTYLLERNAGGPVSASNVLQSVLRISGIKGGSWITFWWLKVSRWNCKSKRWGSWESLWNIDISDTVKLERDKNKFKILGLIKWYLITLSCWYGYCVRVREKTFRNWGRKDFQEVPERLSSKATDTGCPQEKVS